MHPCSLGGGTLEEYVPYHVTLTEYTTTRLTRKIMEGLQYLHDSRIIHVNLTVSDENSDLQDLVLEPRDGGTNR